MSSLTSNLTQHRRYNINTVIKFIEDKLKGSSSCFGYRYTLQKLRCRGLRADKETVRLILKSLDPVGVDRKKEAETSTS